MALLIKCEWCGVSKTEVNFYRFKSGERDTICKQCVKESMNEYEEKSYLPWLERYDIPYNVYKWKQYQHIYPHQCIFGRYYTYMNLHGLKGYHYGDHIPGLDKI